MSHGKQKRGGRPAMSAPERRRVRAALRALRARHASWEALAQALGVRTRTLARVMNEDAGASMSTVARVAIQILPSTQGADTAVDPTWAARTLLAMSVENIRALGRVAPGPARRSEGDRDGAA